MKKPGKRGWTFAVYKTGAERLEKKIRLRTSQILMNRFSVFSFFAPRFFCVRLCVDFAMADAGLKAYLYPCTIYRISALLRPFVWTYSRLISLHVSTLHSVHHGIRILTLARRLFMRRKFLIPVTITTPLCFFESLRIYIFRKLEAQWRIRCGGSKVSDWGMWGRGKRGKNRRVTIIKNTKSLRVDKTT